MTITDAVAESYLRATGKTTALTSGTKFDRIVSLLDYYQRAWAREPGTDWNSLYNPAFSLGTVTATDTYDLDTSSIRNLSSRQGDPVRIMWTDGVAYTDYTIVPHNTLKDYYWGQLKQTWSSFYCAQIGPQLIFNHIFNSNDKQFGGEITIPCYVFPDPITSTSMGDEVQVDEPSWLTARVAAEYVRNDITRRARYPELLAEANEIMERMKDDNEGQIDLVERPWTPFSGNGSDDPWGW